MLPQPLSVRATVAAERAEGLQTQHKQEGTGTGSRGWPPFLGTMRPTHREAFVIFWAPRPLPHGGHHLPSVRPLHS